MSSNQTLREQLARVELEDTVRVRFRGAHEGTRYEIVGTVAETFGPVDPGSLVIRGPGARIRHSDGRPNWNVLEILEHTPAPRPYAAGAPTLEPRLGDVISAKAEGEAVRENFAYLPDNEKDAWPWQPIPNARGMFYELKDLAARRYVTGWARPLDTLDHLTDGTEPS